MGYRSLDELENDDDLIKVEFLVFVRRDQGDIRTFAQHLAQHFVEALKVEAEAHDVKVAMLGDGDRDDEDTPTPPQVDSTIAELEAMFRLPTAEEPDHGAS